MTLTFDPNYYRNVTDVENQPESEIVITSNIGHFRWVEQEEKMTENELLNELAKELTLPDIEPDEVTAVMLSESVNCSWSKAASVLKTKLAAGELTARKVRTPEGKIATAYRKAA